MIAVAALCLVGVCHLCGETIEVGQCLCSECRDVYERRVTKSAEAIRLEFVRQRP